MTATPTYEPAQCSKREDPPSRAEGSGGTSARMLAAMCTYNEVSKVGWVLERLKVVEGIRVLVVDDGSTDGTPALLRRRRDVTMLHHPHRRGAGAGVRTAIHHFLEGDYEVLIFIAGNNKDEPREIPRLVGPILRDELDLVQGSRYLPGGARRPATRPRTRLAR